MNRRIFITILFFAIFQCVFGQEQTDDKKEAPAYNTFRADENYEYLKDEETNPYEADFFDPIKFIPLNKTKSSYLSFGGQLRPRFEHFSNKNWDREDDQDYYSQRISLYFNLTLGKYVQVFGELYHGYTSNEKEFTQYDEIAFHQAFVSFKVPLNNEASLNFRFGRQEMAFGATRLIGVREGPNIRRSFDAPRLIYKKGKTNIQAFYAREVKPTFYAFDNRFTLFDSNAANPKLWGLYNQFNIKGVLGTNELYYLGFESQDATFNDVSGKESRHSIGLRHYGTVKERWSYNTEIIYQFGTLGNSDISAFNIEFDWDYKFPNTYLKPNPGLKLEYSSGDKNTGDGNINSFNPMFVNPSYYSLATTITPVNLISVHPSITIEPIKKLKLYAEWAFFWRASKNDGLYSPPRSLNRPATDFSGKSLGSQIGFKASYEFNRHLSFDLDMSYFTVSNGFLSLQDKVDNILHIAPTFSYKF